MNYLLPILLNSDMLNGWPVIQTNIKFVLEITG